MKAFRFFHEPLGITVIDVTEIDDKGDINHSRFSDSPVIVQLIGRSLERCNTP